MKYSTEPIKIRQAAMFKAISKNALVLGLFALVSVGSITITYLVTKDKIAKEVEISLIKQLSDLVPVEHYTNKVYHDCINVKDNLYLGTNVNHKVYRMRAKDKNHALMLMTTAPDGYSGNIDIAIVISVDEKIIGVNVIDHKETPGLGDKIERKKSDWLNQFNKLSLSQLEASQWQVKKDGGKFDSLTGATITPRAIIKAIHKGLIYVSKNHQFLFQQPSNCYTSLNDGRLPDEK